MNVSGRYSQHARRVMMQARLFAHDSRHAIVDTSHLLIGILRVEGCIGHRVLCDLNMDREAAERRAAALHRSLRHPPHDTPMSPALRETLAFAVEESQLLDHHYIGTEHLLLGLARSGGGAARTLLHESAVSFDQLRRQVRRVLQEGETEIGLERAMRMARLSELSRRVLSRAALLAEDMRHPHADLLHLILALSQERRSPAGRMLRRCGLDEAQLVLTTAQHALLPDNALEDVLDEAVLLAERMGSHYTGTDHIVITLANDRRGSRLLMQHGVDLKRLTGEVLRLMRQD